MEAPRLPENPATLLQDIRNAIIIVPSTGGHRRNGVTRPQDFKNTSDQIHPEGGRSLQQSSSPLWRHTRMTQHHTGRGQPVCRIVSRKGQVKARKVEGLHAIWGFLPSHDISDDARSQHALDIEYQSESSRSSETF